MTSDAKVRWTFIVAIFMAVGATAVYLLTKFNEFPLWIQALYLITMMVAILVVAFIFVDIIETWTNNRWRKQNKLKREKEARAYRTKIYSNLPIDMSIDGKNALTDRIILNEQKQKQIDEILAKKTRNLKQVDDAQQAIRDLDATLRELAPDMFPKLSEAENMKAPVEKPFVLKIDTHFVMKKEHARTWLTPTQYTQLSNLITRVHMKRLSKGIPAPEYWVINKDEPYSYKIEDVIQEGETKK